MGLWALNDDALPAAVWDVLVLCTVYNFGLHYSSYASSVTGTQNTSALNNTLLILGWIYLYFFFLFNFFWRDLNLANRRTFFEHLLNDLIRARVREIVETGGCFSRLCELNELTYLGCTI